MKQGDFSQCAESYHNRPGYSEVVLRNLANYTGAFSKPDFKVADVGAGTGKLTECLLALDLKCTAVEPNDAMREQGKKYLTKHAVDWHAGSGEETGLSSASFNWLLMGSSFHWVDRARGLKEFYRVLRPGGYFTAIWNPRDIESSPFHMRIEELVNKFVPGLNRVSSGSAKYTATLHKDLLEGGYFKDVIFCEACHEIEMDKARYLGVWRSVNDIQSQAGPERFENLMRAIEEEIGSAATVRVPYKTRAWTATRV